VHSSVGSDVGWICIAKIYCGQTLVEEMRTYQKRKAEKSLTFLSKKMSSKRLVMRPNSRTMGHLKNGEHPTPVAYDSFARTILYLSQWSICQMNNQSRCGVSREGIGNIAASGRPVRWMSGRIYRRGAMNRSKALCWM